MKNLFAALFGFLFSLFAEGFSRIIISFFHGKQFTFFGIDALPSLSWIIIIYVVSFISYWLGGMFAQTLANQTSNKAWYILLAITFFWMLFSVLATYRVVPLWYVVSYPFAGLLGLLLALKLYKKSTNETIKA